MSDFKKYIEFAKNPRFYNRIPVDIMIELLIQFPTGVPNDDDDYGWYLFS